MYYSLKHCVNMRVIFSTKYKYNLKKSKIRFYVQWYIGFKLFREDVGDLGTPVYTHIRIYNYE